MTLSLYIQIFKSIKEKYPEYNLYVSTKPENNSLLWANEYVHKTIPYAESFDNSLPLEGAGQAKEHFAIVFTPYLTTQKFSNYIHNMKNTWFWIGDISKNGMFCGLYEQINTDCNYRISTIEHSKLNNIIPT